MKGCVSEESSSAHREEAGQTKARSRATSAALKSSTCTAIGVHLQPDTMRRMESMVLGVRWTNWMSTRTWNTTSSDAKDSQPSSKRDIWQHYVECDGQEMEEEKDEVSRLGTDMKTPVLRSPSPTQQNLAATACKR